MMFDWLKKRRAFGTSNGHQAPDAKAVAMFIVYNLFIHEGSCFGVPVERVAAIKAQLPDVVREAFGAWGCFYIAWTLMQRSGERFGDEFRADVTALVPACLEPVRGTAADTDVIIRYVRRIFDMMDDTRRAGDLVNIGGYEMPIVGRVAMNLIALEEDYNEAKARAFVELGLALEELHELAEPYFDVALARVADNKTQ